MTETSQAAEQDLLDIIFGPAADGQTYLNLLYLLLAFPLGIAYFILLVGGLSAGFGLLVVFIGLPLLIGVFELCRGLGAFERLLARGMLHLDIAPPPALSSSPGVLPRLKAQMADTVTWKSLVYLGLKFPFGIAAFTVLVTSFAVSISLTLTPLIYRIVPMDIGFWTIENKDEAAICCMIGVILLLLSFHLVNGLAYLWGRFAEMMLGPDQ